MPVGSAFPWFRLPFLDLLLLQMLRPDSSNLPCLYSNFHLKYPLELSRFCFPVGWLVTPTDRPKSVRNRCVIEVFGGVCVLSFGFRIFCWYRGFCHRTESDLLFLFQTSPKCHSLALYTVGERRGIIIKRNLNSLPQYGFFGLIQLGIKANIFRIWTTHVQNGIPIYQQIWILTSTSLKEIWRFLELKSKTLAQHLANLTNCEM